MVRRATLVAVAALVLVVLAGCTSGGGAGDAPESTPMEHEDGGEGMTGTPMATPLATEAAADRPVEDGGGDVVVQPAIIRTGTVTLRVDDFDASRRSVAGTVRGMGGYVSDSGETRHRTGNRSWKTGYLVLRVPKGSFPDLLAAVRESGVVLREETSTRDVSDQLVDLNARLENLRAQRERLREFYRRANDTEDLLAIEERLSRVQGDIERLEAKKRALQDRVAYSTLRVELREPSLTPTPSPTASPRPSYHETSLSAAVRNSVHSLVVLGRSSLVTAAYLLPYAAVGAPLLAGGALLVRRRRGPGGGLLGRRDGQRADREDDSSAERDDGDAAGPDDSGDSGASPPEDGRNG